MSPDENAQAPQPLTSYVPDNSLVPEFTIQAVILGFILSIASNGESLAAAVILTVPALFFLGYEVTNTTVFLLGTALCLGVVYILWRQAAGGKKSHA